MIPIDFPERNFIYTKPAGWTDEQCSDLPVWKGVVPIDDQGNVCASIISKWQLNKEDLEEIARTGCLYLSITGTVMIPVSVMVESPFNDNGE